MELSVLANSRSYYEFSDDMFDPEMAEFNSFKGRLRCLAELLVKWSVLPFALIYKFYRTFLRFFALGLSALSLAATLGLSVGARDFFVDSASSLAADLADWVIYPFAVLACTAKLLVGCLVHPALHFKF